MRDTVLYLLHLTDLMKLTESMIFIALRHQRYIYIEIHIKKENNGVFNDFVLLRERVSLRQKRIAFSRVRLYNDTCEKIIIVQGSYEIVRLALLHEINERPRFKLKAVKISKPQRFFDVSYGNLVLSCARLWFFYVS